jgi:hypothetical protein
MAIFNVYCKKDMNNPTDILVKNGDIGNPDDGWFSSTMENESRYDVNVNEGDVIKIQLIENSGIWSLTDITIKDHPDAFIYFENPLVKTIGVDSMGPKPITAITCTVKKGAPTNQNPLDYLIWYSLIGDGLITSPRSHDPKIRINSK